eukprot:m.306878 g.306878  ORF g.306878 m.306878 type:complete len:510 (+) comp41664_c0_seq1:50-1579(+)
MAVNLSKFGKELKEAYEDVISSETGTDWALFGYDKQSNDLKVVETGDGGIEELADEVNGSRVQYAWCKVTDPNSNLPKFVLINWFGEGAPSSRLGVCQRHVGDVASFLRGSHVTINARIEDDLDTDTIVNKVAKSSGSNYSFHKEKARPVEPQGAVGSVYKKADARADIVPEKRDEFWSQQDKIESQRKVEDRKAKADETRRKEQERKDREAQETSVRDQKVADRARAVDIQKTKEREELKRRQEEEKAHYKAKMEAFDAETERDKRHAEDSRRRQREEERQAIGAAVRQTKESVAERQAEAREAQEEADRARQAAEDARMAVEEAKRLRDEEAQAEAEAEAAAAEEAAREAEEAAHQAEEAAQQAEEELQEAEPESEPEPEPEQPEEDSYYGNVEESQPEPAADEEENAVYDDVGNEPNPEPEAPEAPEEGLYDVVETPQRAPAAETGGGGGETACAVYDYQATDETEITFDPGDMITEIEKIDEGWWKGRAPDGQFGMFPSNYVELV